MLLNAEIILFFKLSSRDFGQVTEKIIFVSECSITHIGKIAFLISSIFSLVLLKLLLFLIERSK